MAIFSQSTIRRNTRILKTRTLPSPGKVLVEVGDTVGPSAIIAKTDYLRESPRVIDLNAELKTKLTPDLTDKALVKQPGDKVVSGETVARFKDEQTGKITDILSPCNGIVQYISRLGAKIALTEDSNSMKPMTVVPVSSILDVKPRWLRSQVTVREGDYVQEGQIIAGTPHAGSLALVYSPISGIIARICPKAGTVTIVRPMKTLKVLAHIPGKIVQPVENLGAVIQGFGSLLEGVFGIGSERFGSLTVKGNSPQDVLDEAGIGPEAEGSILVAGAGATYQAISKAIEFGARGLIAGGLNQKDLATIAGQEINPQNTAIEDLEFTLIMTEGAGYMPMNEQAWQVFKEGHGHLASVDGTTGLSGSLRRPWIFINHASPGEKAIIEATEPHIGLKHSLGQPVTGTRGHASPGDRIRCLRQPYFGLWGTVEENIPEKVRVESEGLMEAVKVRLDDGRLVTVAEANIEVIIPA